MRWLVGVAAVSMFLAAAPPAQACMGEPLPEAVLFDRPPARPPPGYSVIEVVGSARSRPGGRLQARVLDPAWRRRIGGQAVLAPERMTSCTDWGRLGFRAFAVVRPAGRLHGKALLHVRIYRRSWWDRFWSFLGIALYTPA